MRTFGPQISFFSLLLAAAITLACGSSLSHVSPNCTSSAITANATGIPQSITVCPATADAKDFLDGQVQFIATGHYLNQPPVMPLTNAYWGACYQNAPTDAVAINNKGLAQCDSGARGTYSIFATMQTNCLSIAPCGGGCEISGYAQLICP
jgi:hypothetical protein